MKLKTYAILLTILTFIEMAVLALSSEGGLLTKISISNIGSIKGNYLFYLIATSVLLIVFCLFLHKLYKSLGHQPTNVIYIIPVLGIIALLFKAPAELSLGEMIHTIIFVIISVLILIVVYDVNKILSKKNKTDHKIYVTPKVVFYGTVGAFIVIGLNVITEMVYIGAILSWMHFIGGAIISS